MLSLIKSARKKDGGQKGKSSSNGKLLNNNQFFKDSSSGPNSGGLNASMELPGSRPASAMQLMNNERPSSRSSNSSRRSNQPRLGVNTYLFEDDPGIMSEVETASTRFRKTTSSSSTRPPPAASSGARLPRTSINNNKYQLFSEDDPGIMSEAETASTTRGKRSSNRNHSIPSMGGYYKPQQQRSVQFRHPLAQIHTEAASSYLSEDDLDPGIMSEADTSSTSGRKRRQIQLQQIQRKKADLPIVRTPSKTLERPLGLVFLVYRGETKRAVLPNEITSLDTVKALFVRSFQKTLTMEYMDTPRVHIYIHDSTKDIFYELENLGEIRDRTVLKLFEADSSGRGPSGLGPSGLPPITNSDDEAGFPGNPPNTGEDLAAGAALSTGTYPGGARLSAGRLAPVQLPLELGEPEYVDSRHVKAMKALNRVQREYETLPRNTFSLLEQEKIAAILNHQTSIKSSGHGGHFKMAASSPESVVIPSRFSGLPEASRYYPRPESTEEAKARMMHMEAQLSQLTGMVEKALKNKRLGKKTVSFDKSVTFSDDPPPQQQQQVQGILVTANKKILHQNGGNSSSVVPASNGLLLSSSGQPQLQHNHRCLAQPSAAAGPESTELYHNLRRLHKSTRELKQEVRVLRRLTQLQSMAMKDLVQDTFIKLREACITFSTHAHSQPQQMIDTNQDPELWRLATDEEAFIKDLNELVTTTCQLEAKVEETRSGVINKKNKISLVDVESMALTLSKCSKTVTLLKQAFPSLEANIKSGQQPLAASNPERRRMTEDFLKRTPERMENIWRRCKKLTGTLVTLKRLASVQEQRFHLGNNALDSSSSLSPIPPSSSNSEDSSTSPNPRRKSRPLSFEESISEPAQADPLADTDSADLASKKAAPPPPPPRSSSSIANAKSSSDEELSLTSSSESVNSQELKKPPPVAAKPTNVDIKSLTAKARQDALEQRHQELLSRQKQLQEQYQRLQNMQKKSSNGEGGHNGTTPEEPILDKSAAKSAVATADTSAVASADTSAAASADDSASNSAHTFDGKAAVSADTSAVVSADASAAAKKKLPPAVPVRINSSLSNNNQKDQKVYETEII